MKVYNDNQLYQSPAGDQLRNSGRQNWIFGRIGDQEGAISDPDYAWSAVNDVKRLQTGYIKNFRYLMTTGCGNTIVSRWRCHSRGRKHRDQAIKWIRLNIVKSPSRQRCPKTAKNYQISPLPLFNPLSSQEKAVHCRILENKVWEWKSLLRESFDQ